jgi:hypothetical protein
MSNLHQRQPNGEREEKLLKFMLFIEKLFKLFKLKTSNQVGVK